MPPFSWKRIVANPAKRKRAITKAAPTLFFSSSIVGSSVKASAVSTGVVGFFNLAVARKDGASSSDAAPKSAPAPILCGIGRGGGGDDDDDDDDDDDG